MDLAAIYRRIETAVTDSGKSARAVSLDAKLSGDAIRNMERGIETGKTKGISTHTLSALATALNVSPAWLLTGEGEQGAPREVPLLGYIGAGGHVTPADNGETGDTVSAPSASHPDTVAATISGTSQLPMFHDGWTLYWSVKGPASERVNLLSVVQTGDGRVMVKTIRNGSEPGLYTLTSLNAADETDVPLDWAAEIDWIRPR